MIFPALRAWAMVGLLTRGSHLNDVAA